MFVPVFPHETADSYWRRLCAFNCVEPGVVWKQLQVERPELPTAPAAYLAPQAIARLGGLPADAFPPPVRMHVGTGGRVRRRGVSEGASMCRRCAAGQEVYVRGMSGPVCVKHRRWHLGGADDDISDRPRHIASQRKLNGAMKLRGAGYDSHTMTAVRELIFLWGTDDIRRGATESKIIFERFPLEVEILVRLTMPDVVHALLSNKTPPPVQALTVAEIVTSVMEGRPQEVRHLVAPSYGSKIPRYGRWNEIDGYAASLRPRISRLIPLLMRHVDSRTPSAERLRLLNVTTFSSHTRPSQALVETQRVHA